MSTSTLSFCPSGLTSTISPSKSLRGPEVTFTDSPPYEVVRVQPEPDDDASDQHYRRRLHDLSLPRPLHLLELADRLTDEVAARLLDVGCGRCARGALLVLCRPALVRTRFSCRA